MSQSTPPGTQPSEEVERRTGGRWLTTLPNLADHKLRVAFATAELNRLPAGDVATGLNLVCRLAEQSDMTARQVIGAFAPTIVDAQALDKVWSVRTTAAAMALMSVSRFLRASSPEGHLLDDKGNAMRSAVLQSASGKPLTLGERRMLARRPSRATLNQLMRDPHPMVTRIVLNNPRITEDDVVRMAAHRPAMADIAREIAMAWSRSTRVRMALILNPGLPPAITVPLLPLLTRPELASVMQAADLPLVVRATAREHHELRPPMPPGDTPTQKH